VSHITFDTLQFVETLKASGIDEKQAKAIATAYKNASSDQELVTKRLTSRTRPYQGYAWRSDGRDCCANHEGIF